MNPCGTTPRAMRLRSGRLNHSLANLPSPDDLGSGIVMGWLRGERTVNAPPTPKRLETKEENGAPGEIRTPNPQIRSRRRGWGVWAELARWEPISTALALAVVVSTRLHCLATPSFGPWVGRGTVGRRHAIFRTLPRHKTPAATT